MLSSWKRERLIQELLNLEVYPHAVDKVQHIETHISHIFLAGEYAYKIKKALNLGFLDFSTLEKRKQFCEEEIRLNSRLAESIYISVATIVCRGEGEESVVLVNSDENTEVEKGEVVEYAVRMHRFPHNMELDRLLEESGSGSHWRDEWIDEIALQIAAFHEEIAFAPPHSEYGNSSEIISSVLENFEQIDQLTYSQESFKGVATLSAKLHQWSISEWRRVTAVMERRQQAGDIRECHGDMHLANMVYWKGKVQIFDGIEFSPSLRWIDRVSEIAFLVMDLESRGREDLAWRFLNGYLSWSGDYAGLELLNFYCTYRAAVRGKVAAIRHAQMESSPEQKSAKKELVRYLELAEHYTKQKIGGVIVMQGLSGSGKSTLAKPLVEQLPAIWIRSDVERKRLFGEFPGIDEPSMVGDLYSREAGIATYQRLQQLSEMIVGFGMSVIVDATFLHGGWAQSICIFFSR